MSIIEKEELKQIEGGLWKVAVSKWIIGLGAAATFIVGMFTGYTNGSGVCK